MKALINKTVAQIKNAIQIAASHRFLNLLSLITVLSLCSAFRSSMVPPFAYADIQTNNQNDHCLYEFFHFSRFRLFAICVRKLPSQNSPEGNPIGFEGSFTLISDAAGLLAILRSISAILIVSLSFIISVFRILSSVVCHLSFD
jgi:hypothetical protein